MSDSLRDRYLGEARRFDENWQNYQKGLDPAALALRFPVQIDRLARWIYAARRYGRQDMTAEEDHLATQMQNLAQIAGPRREFEVLTWTEQYRTVWRRNFGLFLFTMVMFVAATLVGIGIGINHSSYLAAVAGPRIMESILDHEAWFERLRKDPVFGAMGIAANNIKVSITCYMGGALLGLGGWLVLMFNGLMFGMIIGFCFKNDFHIPLMDFVSTHGPLELTVIIASAFASFLVGRTFWRGPYRDFRARLGRASLDSVNIMMGVTPWLILAGLLEGCVSPYPFASPWQKILIGVLAAAAFWLWTFWPTLPGPNSATNGKAR